MAVRKIPATLRPGDVVEFEGERYEVLAAPFLGHSGASVFDESTLFWRAKMRSLRDPTGVRYGTWRVGHDAVIAA